MKTIIHIKTDKEIKENAQELARELGLSLSDVINSSLRNFIRTRTVVFTDIPQMTPKLEKKLKIIDSDIKHKRNLSPTFASAKDAIEYLNNL